MMTGYSGHLIKRPGSIDLCFEQMFGHRVALFLGREKDRVLIPIVEGPGLLQAQHAWR